MQLVPLFFLPEYQHHIWSCKSHLPLVRRRLIEFQICCPRPVSHQQLSSPYLLFVWATLWESCYSPLSKVHTISLILFYPRPMREKQTDLLRGSDSSPRSFFAVNQRTKSWKPLLLYLHTILKYLFMDCCVGLHSPIPLPSLMMFSARKYFSFLFSVSHPLRPSSNAISMMKLSPVLSQLSLIAPSFVLP